MPSSSRLCRCSEQGTGLRMRPAMAEGLEMLLRLCQYQRQPIVIMLLRWKAQLAIVILVFVVVVVVALSECNELHVVASCWVENEFTLKQITCVCPLSNQICSHHIPSLLRTQLFSWHVVHCVYAECDEEYFLFFAPLLWLPKQQAGYALFGARLFIIIVELTLGDVPKSNLIQNWQSEADTTNLLANLICRPKVPKEWGLRWGNGHIIGLQTYCPWLFIFFSAVDCALHIAIWNIEKVLSPATRVA